MQTLGYSKSNIKNIGKIYKRAIFNSWLAFYILEAVAFLQKCLSRVCKLQFSIVLRDTVGSIAVPAKDLFTICSIMRLSW